MISLSPDINFAILTNYYLCLITENNMRPLIYCPVQFAGGWLEKLWFFFIHYSTFVPFQNSLLQTVLDETLQPVLWLNLAVTSFRVCRLFVFTLRKRITRSRFSSSPTSWQVFNVSSFSHPLQKFMDCSTVDACHILYFIARKTFIWQIYNYFFLLCG
jgi:hypothetical protein